MMKLERVRSMKTVRDTVLSIPKAMKLLVISLLLYHSSCVLLKRAEEIDGSKLNG